MVTADTRAAFEQLLSALVRIETENPPGNEREGAAFMAEWFADRGIEATLVERPDPDRPQVAARVGEGAPTLVLNGHVDVVPAGDHGEWTYDPYGATVEDGKLYGRGSTDMKAGLAIAMLTAARLQADIESGELAGSLVVHGAMGEETADPGTRVLLEEGFDGDYGVVLEPTEFVTATSEKGLAWYEITVEGEPSHASRPDQGSNAIRNAEPVLDALAAYDREVRELTDDLVGTAYATVTQFVAGADSNKAVVPERARITLDRRFLPSESAAEIDARLDELLAETAAAHGLHVEWERTQTYESAAIPPDSHVAEVFRKHSAAVAGVSTEPWGTKASSDVRNLINDAGMEAVVWGPGSNDQAHTQDEFVDIDEAAVGIEVLERVARELLSP